MQNVAEQIKAKMLPGYYLLTDAEVWEAVKAHCEAKNITSVTSKTAAKDIFMEAIKGTDFMDSTEMLNRYMAKNSIEFHFDFDEYKLDMVEKIAELIEAQGLNPSMFDEYTNSKELINIPDFGDIHTKDFIFFVVKKTVIYINDLIARIQSRSRSTSIVTGDNNTVIQGNVGGTITIRKNFL